MIVLTDAIKISNVSKSYPGVQALDNISFSVEKGCVHGFLGPNGAGKSTTMNIITGLIPASSGSVDLGGLSVGFLPEHPPLYENMKVKNFLKFVDGIQGGEGAHLNEVIEKCHLTDVQERLIGNLSKGYRQRVGIAQAMVSNPDIIILDEPTVGLDPAAIVEIRELINSLKKDHTILLSSHLLHEVTKTCSHITIIDEGKILATGSLEEIQGKFQNQQGVRVLVKDWKPEWKNDLIQSFGLGECHVENNGNNIELVLFSGAKEDFRSELSEYIVNKKMGLLGMEKIEMGLEDIFKNMTEKDHES